MKVDSVKNVYPQKAMNTPTFGKKGLDPEVIALLNKDNGRLAKFLNYVGENQGEALNILVTAFGTAVICPMFIAFNPLSKEDRKTKEYSAWRQPISAAIAVATQLTITKYFNNWIAKEASTVDKRGKTGLSSRADLRAQPHERYLKRIVKLQHPEFTKKEIAKEVKRLQIIAEKREIAKQRSLLKDKNITMKELICQDYIDKAKEAFFEDFKKNNQAEIEKKFNKGIDDVWSLKLNKHLNKMLEEKAKSLGKDVSTLLNEEAEKLVERDVISESVVKTTIRHLKNKRKDIKIEEAIKNCSEDKIVNIIKEQGLEKYFPDGIDAKAISKYITSKLQDMKEYEDANKLKDFTSTTNIGTKFDEILQNVKIKKLVRSRTSDAKRVFKTMNTQMGLVVTLATLPFTCGFLNWAYPRIMEKIMPEMSAKKKETDAKLNEMKENINSYVDNLNLDDLKDKIDIEDLKSKLKLAVQKGDDN